MVKTVLAVTLTLTTLGVAGVKSVSAMRSLPLTR